MFYWRAHLQCTKSSESLKMLFQTNVEKDGYREWFNNLPCNIKGSVLNIKLLKRERTQADIAGAKKKDTYEIVSCLTNILENYSNK